MPTELHLDLNHPDFVYNPYPSLAQLREQTPVFWDPQWNKMFFLRYEDIASLLRDKRLGRSITHILSRDELGWPPPNLLTQDFDRFQSNHLLDNEPPKHTRLKSLFLKAFTPARVEGLRGQIQQMVNQLLDQIEDQGRMDVVQDYAEPLPVAVIAELLGVPHPDRHLLRPWSAAIVKLYELGYSDEQAKAANQAVVDFSNYIKDLVKERRRKPQDDLLGALILAEEAGDRLTEEELVANCILLLNAGHEATVNGTTAGLLALERNPQQKALLIEAARGGYSEFFKPAIEELLRYDTPLPMFERWVLEDLQINGITLRKGQEVALMYASGNRDPGKFPNPDQLRLDRRENQHLTFGLGIHYCIGAPLARLELQTSFQSLFARLPNLRLSNTTPQYTGGFVIRGIAQLPAEW